MANIKRVTKRKEGGHFVISIGGQGMTLANTPEEAAHKMAEIRRNLKTRAGRY